MIHGPIDLLEEFLPLNPSALPGLIPNLLVSIIVGCTVGAIVGRKVGLADRWRSALWLSTALVAVSYTWTKHYAGRSYGCDLSPPDLTTAANWILPDTRANIVLFVPLGMATMLIPVGKLQLIAGAMALAIPPMVELGQLLARPLGRTCQVSDVVFNLLGVGLGFALASGVITAWRSWVLAANDRT